MEECIPLEKENPREVASLLSRLCFLWTSDCILDCNRKHIRQGDLYKCPESHRSNKNGDFLEDQWKEELKTCWKRNSTPSLLRILFRAYLFEYLPLALTAFLNYVVMKGLEPLLLSKLIRLFIDKNYTWVEMLLYGGGLGILIFCSSFLLHHTVCGSNLLAIKIRLAVSSLVYRKVLRLNQKSLFTTSSGQVTNLLSNDVGRFETAVQAFHFLWMTPIQLTVIIFVIWSLFGLGALIGICSLVILMIPFQGLLGHLTGVYRKDAAEKTDLRVKIMNEIFSGMEVIKMYTWEMAFKNLVRKIRQEEIRFIKRTSYIRGILACMMFVTERLGLCITVVCYSLLGFPVSTDVVFSVSVCFRILQYSLGTMLPAAVTIGSEVLVSVKRLEEFLMLEEIVPVSKTTGVGPQKVVVQLRGVSATWQEKKITLDNVSISISEGCLCGIVGPVGSGKSSLLKLLLGEIPILKGSVQISGIISYSSQKPWLFSSSIWKNIIFDQDFDDVRYKKVIEVCGLIQDLEQLQNGDQTIVGSRGLALSGGQRARISLARAIYKRADIYLLDDILSALDVRIGKYVFEECILSFLRGKTIVLVTHQIHYLEKVDHVVILKDGYVEEQGKFCELFESRIKPYLHDESEEYVIRNIQEIEDVDEVNEAYCMEDKNSPVQQMEDVTDIKGSVIWKYISFTGGYFNIVLLFLFLFISQLSLNLSDYWLTLWSEQEYIRYSHQLKMCTDSSNRSKSGIPKMDSKSVFYFLYSTNITAFSDWTDIVFVNENEFILIKASVMRAIYILVIFLAISFMLLRSTFFFHLCIKASQQLHHEMFTSFLKAPMAFFYATPTGNSLNRFSKDLGAADELFPKALLNVLASMPVLLGSMILITVSNSFMLLLIIPLWLMLFKIRKWFLITVRTLRRIETSVKSPIFSYMTSTLDGVTTIRSSKCEDRLIPQFDRYQDKHTAASYLAISCTSAFGLWLDLLCVSFVCCVILLFIILDRYIYISGSFIGLAIFHSMTMVGLFQFCIRTLSETVNYLTNIERILGYTQLEKEENVENKTNGGLVSREWPSRGEIEFRNLNFRYSVGDKLVLKDINLNICGSEKIGIVGRTGAGKSSIISALFRLAKIEGDIYIDGINIEYIELKKLRREITIIPQEPVLFSASVRFNLDPYFEFPDERIWKVLAEVEIEKAIPSLDHQLTEGGNNLSVGQRQLLCLARAILKGNKILILDEATANVDTRADDLIQETIKKKFHNATVLTVAHRLSSVIYSDRVLVMEDGKVVEFDRPWVLMQKENGYFKALVDEAGFEIASLLKNMELQKK